MWDYNGSVAYVLVKVYVRRDLRSALEIAVAFGYFCETQINAKR